MKMSKKRFHFFLLISCAIFAILGIIGYISGMQANAYALTYNNFICQLSKGGLEVSDRIQPVDRVDAPLFSVRPKVVSVYQEDKKEEIYVYIFPDKKMTDSESGKVSKCGNKVGGLYLGNSMRCYKCGNMMFAYFGGNKTIINSLEKIVGKPFTNPDYQNS